MCKEDIKNYVKSGLLRLATGACNDAIKLAFCDEQPNQEQLEQMDLFNVSEIKRVKGGGVEIKLFDRQKAFEKLFEFAAGDESENSAKSLLEALSGKNGGAENEEFEEVFEKEIEKEEKDFGETYDD